MSDQLPKIGALIPARNEEKCLGTTLRQLSNQTLKIDETVILNDGSSDRTEEIARQSGCFVIDLPPHKESYVGRPELAKVINIGLEHLKKIDLDYVLIVGADHILPRNYLEVIVTRMENNPKLVVGSGRVQGEPMRSPRGSGRLINVKFWKKANDMQYPVGWGWETWLVLKAMQMGYETRYFRDVLTEVERPTRLKAGQTGKAMYALGYYWKNVVADCILTFFKNPKAGLIMFWNWFLHKNVERLDIADWVNDMQRRRFSWRRTCRKACRIIRQIRKG